MGTTKKLKKEEFFELELTHVNDELLKKECEILNLKKQLAQSRKSTLKYMIKELDEGCVVVNEELGILRLRVEKNKKTRDSCVDRIRKRLKLSGKFGYNEDTLEIKE